MKLTTVEGMQSEIFVPITLKPIFTELYEYKVREGRA